MPCKVGGSSTAQEAARLVALTLALYPDADWDQRSTLLTCLHAFFEGIWQVIWLRLQS